MNTFNAEASSKIIKYLSYGLVVFAAIVIAYILFKTPAGVAFALETQGEQFGITLSPANAFLNAPNMAPGEIVSADLTVTNDGEYDFSFDISAQKQSGDDLMYNVLDMEIKDGGGNLLYAGKLKDLNNLVGGVLGPLGSSQNTSVLNFSVSMPVECGNEYQGKGTQVALVFNALEHPSYIVDGGIVWDPPLEKPDVHVRQGEKMPISFHLVKDGVFDTTKRGLDLVISGTGVDDQPVEYVFSVADGTLEWNAHLKRPHYEILFDTEKYPVKPDTYYTATVKYGEQVLEPSTMFKSGQVNVK